MTLEKYWIWSAVFWSVAIAAVFGLAVATGNWSWGIISGCWLFLYLPFQIMRYRNLRRTKLRRVVDQVIRKHTGN